MEAGQQDLLAEITSYLGSNKIPYMVTGAWSVIYYGRPRASHDIDFVVEIPPQDVKRVIGVLKRLSSDFQIQETQIERAVMQKSMFNVLYLPYYLKLDFWLLTDDEFDITRFSRKVEVSVLGKKMFFSTAEDTILQKLKWYKLAETDKNIIDAAFVYQVQKKNLNAKYLSKWAKYLKVTRFLNKLDKISLEEHI